MEEILQEKERTSGNGEEEQRKDGNIWGCGEENEISESSSNLIDSLRANALGKDMNQ